MCRLLGVVSSESTDFGFSLRHAPRSLESLSRHHPHGWGLAVHEAERGWDVHRQAACACEDDRFGAVASTARGRLLVAHVRKATVGPTSHLNTHPFRRGGWVFAHNGTIQDVGFLASHTSTTRAREVEGDTDSERYFASLLTLVDDTPRDRLDDALRALLDAAMARSGFGAANFLLSDGEVLYAFRFGRTLFTLERGRGDAVVSTRVSAETEAVLSTPWSARRVAALVASEAISDEPWQELPEGALVRADLGVFPSWRRVNACDEPSGSVRLAI